MGFSEILLLDHNEVPKPGVYRVQDNPEIRSSGGLALREFSEDAEGNSEVGGKIIEDKVVRIPPGEGIKVEKVFRSSNQREEYGVVSFVYFNEFQRKEKTIRGCVQLSYLDAVSEDLDTASSAREDLKDLRADIDGLEQ